MNPEDGIRQHSTVFFAEDGHSYHFNRVMLGGRVSLRCSWYRRTGCPGRCSISDLGQDLRVTQQHTGHRPSQLFRASRQFRAAVLNRCRRGDAAPFQTIYHEERRRMRIPAGAAALVTLNSLRPSMRRARLGNLPPVPRTLDDLHVILTDPRSAHLTDIFNAHDSIYGGTFGNERDQTICTVFVSQRMRMYMRNVRKVFSDATFSVVPAGIEAYQCWNIVTVRRHHIIPLVRVLMKRKTFQAYVVALEAIRQLVPTFNPTTVVCDFEIAQQNAWMQVFNPQNQHGCYFHSSKAITSNARQLGLVPLISRNREVASIIRSSCALALLPPNRLIPGLLALADRAANAGHWDALESFFDYLFRTWVRKGSLFSVYGSEDRTSNACESDNRSLQIALKVAHPNIFQFLGVLILMEEQAWNNIAVLNRGGNLGPRKASAIENDRFIAGFYEDLEEGTIDLCSFLRRASRRIQNIHTTVLDLVQDEGIADD